jgi:hypothetical protein
MGSTGRVRARTTSMTRSTRSAIGRRRHRGRGAGPRRVSGAWSRGGRPRRQRRSHDRDTRRRARPSSPGDGGASGRATHGGCRDLLHQLGHGEAKRPFAQAKVMTVPCHRRRLQKLRRRGCADELAVELVLARARSKSKPPPARLPLALGARRGDGRARVGAAPAARRGQGPGGARRSPSVGRSPMARAQRRPGPTAPRRSRTSPRRPRCSPGDLVELLDGEVDLRRAGGELLAARR